ncbi:MAG: YraN family protein [Chloroflexi bacterium]|nr:YraN family protein [Chloroflexota bacterium]
MSRSRLSLGRRGEQLAADKLISLGYEIVERNFRCPAGEIDLVAKFGETWVFVEVRTRRGADFGSPEESVTLRKKSHLIAAAQTYLQDHALGQVDWRIDFVAVELSGKGELLRVEVIENAINQQ